MQFCYRHPICARNIDGHIAPQHTVTIELVQIKTYACFVWEGCSPHASSSSQLDIYCTWETRPNQHRHRAASQAGKKGPEQKANSTLPIPVGQEYRTANPSRAENRVRPQPELGQRDETREEVFGFFFAHKIQGKAKMHSLVLQSFKATRKQGQGALVLPRKETTLFISPSHLGLFFSNIPMWFIQGLSIFY